MSTKNPIAIVCSDLHLWHTPPVARSGEPDWIKAQSGILGIINAFAKKHGVSVICAGDIFDKPRASPAVEIMAAKNLRGWLCIPGQHDLPNHSIERKGESSYGVMVQTEVIEDLPDFAILSDAGICSFPYGIKLEQRKIEGAFNIAIIHHLVYKGKPPYPGAPTSGNVKNIRKALKGFDVIIAGDNHEGFMDVKKGQPLILNCGSIMRRTTIQEEYNPRIYLLYDNATADEILLPIAADYFSREHIDREKERDDRIQSFVKTLKEDVDIDLSFETNLDRYCEANSVDEEIKTLILEEM